MASVKVAVRVRPFNERELALNSKCIIKMQENKTIIDQMSATTGTGTGTAGSTPKEFIYDASYWSFNKNDAHFKTQMDIFNDLGQTTINNAFDGYNACICAYGQTGSGKSYSMMGMNISDAENDHAEEGLIPRIGKNLFNRIKLNDKLSNATNYRIEVSYLEIYNEKVRDLIRSNSSVDKKNQLGGKEQNLKVREHPKTGVYVQDLSQHTVVSYDDIRELIDRGNLYRTTASTNMNDVSSRSHAIFTIKFSQAKIVENMPSETISKINLVDLAGSERADSTGATGIRLKEGCNINRSLLTFINVISTLADLATSTSNDSTPNRKHYIPYRDSVLTWLLKDSLGGNSKTFILAAISPADLNYVETLSTLRYANRAKNIINKPTINEDPNVKLIRELKAEIVKLKLLLGTTNISASLLNESKFYQTSNDNDYENSLDNETNSEKEDNQYDVNTERVTANSTLPINVTDSSNNKAKNSDEIILKKIDLNQNKIEELTSKWKSKWQNVHSIFDEYENLSIVRKPKNSGISLYCSNEPYLISIEQINAQSTVVNQSSFEERTFPNQSSLNIYPLKEGKTILYGFLMSSSDSDELNDDTNAYDYEIELNASSGGQFSSNTTIKRYCFLNKIDNRVYIRPINCCLQINNILFDQESQSRDDTIELKNGDFIVLDECYLFQFQNPNQPAKTIDTSESTGDNQVNLIKLFKSLLAKEKPTLDQSEHEQQMRHLNEQLAQCESLIVEQKQQIHLLNQQIESNNEEMKKLKESYFVNDGVSAARNDDDDHQDEENLDENENFKQPLSASIVDLNETDLNKSNQQNEDDGDELYLGKNGYYAQINETQCMQHMVEQFEPKLDERLVRNVEDNRVDAENATLTRMSGHRQAFARDEQLLSDCMVSLNNKAQESQLKTYLFELQNLHLREQELRNEMKTSKTAIDEKIEKLNQKRDAKLSELNQRREEIIRNKNLTSLKSKITEINNNEMTLELKIERIRQELIELQTDKSKLEEKLKVKKIYSNMDNRHNGADQFSFAQIEDSENEMIRRARQQLDRTRTKKFNDWSQVESELRLERDKMLAKFEMSADDAAKLDELSAKEANLKDVLDRSLYENEDEKLLVVNELADLSEIKNNLLESVQNKRREFAAMVDGQIESQQRALDELKRVDLEELAQEEERVKLLYESSMTYLQDSINSLKQNIKLKQQNLQTLEYSTQMNNKNMNQLLVELEVMENKRLIEENKIFQKEIQVANEIKGEFEKLSNQMKKIESGYQKKFDDLLFKKESIKPKICNLVGNKNGLQLYQADFSPKISKPTRQMQHTRSDGSFNQDQTTITDNSFQSTANVNDYLQFKKDSLNAYNFKINTYTCYKYGISVEINDLLRVVDKPWQDHWEYMIEMRVNSDSWLILRRYSRIRELHEKMSIVYPSLNRIVFPIRFYLNNGRLLDRKMQLEHYLKCFLEVLVNDPTCPIYLCGSNGSSSSALFAASITNTPTTTNSMSINSISSICSTSSPIVNRSSTGEHHPYLDKAKLCSFCSFFEETPADLKYFKLNGNKNMSNSSSSSGLLIESA